MTQRGLRKKNITSAVVLGMLSVGGPDGAVLVMTQQLRPPLVLLEAQVAGQGQGHIEGGGAGQPHVCHVHKAVERALPITVGRGDLALGKGQRQVSHGERAAEGCLLPLQLGDRPVCLLPAPDKYWSSLAGLLTAALIRSTSGWHCKCRALVHGRCAAHLDQLVLEGPVSDRVAPCLQSRFHQHAHLLLQMGHLQQL